MIKELSFQDIRARVGQNCFCGEDFLFTTIQNNADTEFTSAFSGYVKLTDVMIAVVREGEVDGMINNMPFSMKSGDMLLCTNAIFLPGQFRSNDVKISLMFAQRRLLLESVPFQQLMSAAMFHFDRDYIIVSLTEEMRHQLSLYGDIYNERFKKTETPIGREIIRQLTKCFFCEVIEILAGDDDDANIKIGQNQKIVMRFFDLLEKKQPRPRFIEDYSSELCITPKHLSEVCKKVTGRTALQWITEYVVRDIRYYLLHTDLSIKEIVFLLNFPNPSFFGKYVRLNLGMSPNAFRKKTE